MNASFSTVVEFDEGGAASVLRIIVWLNSYLLGTIFISNMFVFVIVSSLCCKHDDFMVRLEIRASSC